MIQFNAFSERDGWEELNGEWSWSQGRLEAAESLGRNGISFHRDAPFAAVQRVTADLTVVERLVEEGWSVSGVLIFLDPGAFWLLGLTEGPDGRRYVDFLENFLYTLFEHFMDSDGACAQFSSVFIIVLEADRATDANLHVFTLTDQPFL